MRLTAETDLQASRKTRRCFGLRFTNILKAVQQFTSLGDAIIGGSQNLIVCGVWSLVRISLLVCTSNLIHETIGYQLLSLADGHSTCSVSRKAINRLDERWTLRTAIPRYGFALPLNEKLQGCLYEYSILIVGVCHHTAKFEKKSALAQVSSSFSAADVITGSQIELDR